MKQKITHPIPFPQLYYVKLLRRYSLWSQAYIPPLSFLFLRYANIYSNTLSVFIFLPFPYIYIYPLNVQFLLIFTFSLIFLFSSVFSSLLAYFSHKWGSYTYIPANTLMRILSCRFYRHALGLQRRWSCWGRRGFAIQPRTAGCAPPKHHGVRMKRQCLT
jgi:hypothetical protein